MAVIINKLISIDYVLVLMKEGDFVHIDYVGRISATGEIFDLTDEAMAKKEGIHNEKTRYGPALVIVGAHMVIPGIEKRLEQMKVGDEQEFDVQPEEAFGRRNPKLVMIVSRAKFLKENINPFPGMFVDIDGRQAKIQSVSGGRVRVDLNNPLSGKDLHYKVRVVKQFEKPFDKADALIKHYMINCEAELKEGVLTITTEKPMHEFVGKMIEEPIKKWIKEIKNVKFVSKEQNKKPGKPKKTISEK